jgi:hypothetical protein
LISYDLIAGPANSTLGTVSGRLGEDYAWLQWQPPARAAVGTTNVFIIRATDRGSPPLSATNTISFVFVALPPVHSIVINQGAPTLQFSNPIPAQAFLVLWSADVSAANWSPLCEASSHTPIMTVTDTNALVGQRFYRLMPSGSCCYGFCP